MNWVFHCNFLMMKQIMQMEIKYDCKKMLKEAVKKGDWIGVLYAQALNNAFIPKGLRKIIKIKRIYENRD